MYHKWRFKLQISSIFNFDWAHQSWISGRLGVNIKSDKTWLNWYLEFLSNLTLISSVTYSITFCIWLFLVHFGPILQIQMTWTLIKIKEEIMGKEEGFQTKEFYRWRCWLRSYQCKKSTFCNSGVKAELLQLNRTQF